MSSAKRPAWAEYEKLAAQIFVELSPHAEVVHDDHVVGHESEVRRQIDVSARWKDGDIERLLVVQVRDYKRRADVNVVGEFRSVIEDVRADRGILICSGGFSKAAMTYARKKGIDLYSLSDAQSKRWELELTIPTVWHKLIPFLRFSSQLRVEVVPLTISLREDNSPPFFVEKGDRQYDLLAEFKRAWDSGSLSYAEGVEHLFPVDEKLYLEGVDSGGRLRYAELCNLAITYTVDRETYLGHLSPSDYRGLIDHLNDQRFLPSYLEMHFPSLESKEWSRIYSPDDLAIDVAGFFLTAEDARIEVGQFRDFTMKYAGPL